MEWSNDVLNDVFLCCVCERHDAVCHVCATRKNRLSRPRKPLACGHKHDVSSSATGSISEVLRDSQILGSDKLEMSVVDRRTTGNAMKRMKNSETHGMEDEQGCHSEQHGNCENEKSTVTHQILVL